MKEQLFKFITPNKIIFLLSWVLCFSIALPHTILPGKAGSITLLIFILWLFEGNLKAKIQTLYESKLFLSIVAYVLILSISMLWTEYTKTGLVRLSAFKYFLLLIPVLITSPTKKNALNLVHAFVLGTIMHAILMVLFFYKFIDLPDNLNLYSPYSVYSPFFVFSSFYCFFYFRKNVRNKDITLSLMYLTFSLVLIYLIFTNSGRSGQLAFIFSAILILFLPHKNWKQTIILVATSIALLITISLSSKTVNLASYSAIKEIGQEIKRGYYSSWGARLGLLITNIEIIKQNPILGVGLGDTQNEMQRVVERAGNQKLYAIAFYDGSHNHYITILTSAGIIGFIIYILIHIFLFKLPLENKEMKNLSLIFLMILIVNSISDDILFYKPYNIYFAIMIALFINLSRNKIK